MNEGNGNQKMAKGKWIRGRRVKGMVSALWLPKGNGTP